MPLFNFWLIGPTFAHGPTSIFLSHFISFFTLPLHQVKALDELVERFFLLLSSLSLSLSVSLSFSWPIQCREHAGVSFARKFTRRASSTVCRLFSLKKKKKSLSLFFFFLSFHSFTYMYIYFSNLHRFLYSLPYHFYLLSFTLIFILAWKEI